MGTSAGGLIIKTSKGIDESSKFVGDGLTKTPYCDSRKSNCFYFGKTENLLTIVNSNLSDRLFNQTTLDETLFNFFDRPEEVFVFEEYDSGASYGYAIFQNGRLIRKIRTENYNDVTDEFGQPINDELEWLNGTKSSDTDGSILIKNAVNGHEIPEDLLYKAILQLLMLNRFSFTCETMDDTFTERGHYLTTEKTEQQLEKEHHTNRKWWKIW